MFTVYFSFYTLVWYCQFRPCCIAVKLQEILTGPAKLLHHLRSGEEKERRQTCENQFTSENTRTLAALNGWIRGLFTIEFNFCRRFNIRMMQRNCCQRLKLALGGIFPSRCPCVGLCTNTSCSGPPGLFLSQERGPLLQQPMRRDPAGVDHIGPG